MKILFGVPFVLMFIVFIRAEKVTDHRSGRFDRRMDGRFDGRMDGRFDGRNTGEYEDMYKSPAFFTQARADFVVRDMVGVQARGVPGQLLDDGNFIFSLTNGGIFRMMVLTTNDGITIKEGRVYATRQFWKDPSKWMGSPGEYTLQNFKGSKRGEFPAFTTIRSSEKKDVIGQLRFQYNADGQCMSIVGSITGLKPGLHGTHIHQYGDGYESGCKATHGHYNPFETKNGDIGNLGNIVANAEGVAKFRFCSKVIHTIGPFSVIGRSVVVHDGPNGKVGAMVACGVIARAA